MKCSLFTEIQCAEGSSPAQRLEEFLDQAELADRLGFNTYWIAEIHCQPKFSLLSAPYVVLGAAAQRTRKLRLGVAVNTLPVHHPVSLAEYAAMLDLVSNGRMEFAAGGGHPHSRAYECFGADHKSTHEIMAEGLAVIRKAWSEDTLTFKGKFFDIPEVIVNPKPVQKPLPPFWMATSSLDGVEVGARLGVNLFLPIHTRTPEQVVEYAGAYWDGLKRHGHDSQRREIGLLIPMHLAATTAAAKARCETGVMSYFKTIADMRLDYTEWLTQRGAELPARLKTAAGAQVSFETVCDKHAVIGDSRLAVEKIRDLAQMTGATNLLTWFNIGTVPHALVKGAMEQFAAEVMPKLRKGRTGEMEQWSVGVMEGNKMEELTEQKCEACRVGAPSVTPEEISALQPKIPDWRIVTEDGIPKLDRLFKFRNFKDAIWFTEAVGAAAEAEGHHPRLTTEWGKVAVTWWTHKIKNLHKNDFIMAAKTDAIYKKYAQA